MDNLEQGPCYVHQSEFLHLFKWNNLQIMGK
jgi:hypothetical protein